MSLLTGKRAIIAGNDAIGAGIGARFAAEGATVVHRDDADVAADAGERLDILVVNLLGAPRIGTLDTQTDEAFATALAAVTASARAMRAALPALQASDEGRIILIGHRYGRDVQNAIAPYGCAAWALNGLLRSAAIEWGQFGITTNLLLPLADTPEFQAARERRPGVIDLMTGQLALGRIGDPRQDIGGAALYLASDDARYVNGQVIHADGGQHIAGPVLDIGRFG